MGSEDDNIHSANNLESFRRSQQMLQKRAWWRACPAIRLYNNTRRKLLLPRKIVSIGLAAHSEPIPLINGVVVLCNDFGDLRRGTGGHSPVTILLRGFSVIRSIPQIPSGLSSHIWTLDSMTLRTSQSACLTNASAPTHGGLWARPVPGGHERQLES